MRKFWTDVTDAMLKQYVRYAREGRVVAFDTETTGISCCDEIVQIAAVEYVRGVRGRSFATYVKPKCELNPEAAAVNRLTAEYLAEHGIEPTEALTRFFEFVGDDTLLVAHNSSFDVRMVQQECSKFDFSADIAHIPCCDTIALAHRVVPDLPHYRLSCLIDELGLNVENSHDALDDTLACGELFFALLDRA